MVNVTDEVTQPQRSIIWCTNLSNYIMDDSLAIYRFKLLSSGVVGWCVVGWTWWVNRLKVGCFTSSEHHTCTYTYTLPYYRIRAGFGLTLSTWPILLVAPNGLLPSSMYDIYIHIHIHIHIIYGYVDCWLSTGAHTWGAGPPAFGRSPAGIASRLHHLLPLLLLLLSLDFLCSRFHASE